MYYYLNDLYTLKIIINFSNITKCSSSEMFELKKTVYQLQTLIALVFILKDILVKSYLLLFCRQMDRGDRRPKPY